MGKQFDSLTPEAERFIAEQPLFFVGTAPAGPGGHVNVSPKGLDTLRVLSPSRVAYLDLTGSGNETSAHLVENGRVTLMFCSFARAPQILRIYGQGRVVLPVDASWSQLASHFAALPGMRQIIVVDVDRVQTSCGFGVPRMAYEGQRDTLVRWAENKGEAGIAAYQESENAVSLDGLPTHLALATKRS